QDKCRVRPVKADVNDSSIVSPPTPSGTVLNLAEESCSTWLDYVGPLITDELDSKKRWSYRDPDGNVQGSFSLAQLRMWKDYFPSDLKIWSYYGNVKETILLHSALKRQTNDADLRLKDEHVFDLKASSLIRSSRPMKLSQPAKPMCTHSARGTDYDSHQYHEAYGEWRA
nr:zinc finger CCCH domain-containing protein 19 [Tanacetum cinerariifolium]